MMDYEELERVDYWEEQDKITKEISLILPRIYLSGLEGAKRKEELKAKKIKHVLSILCHGDDFHVGDGFDQYHFYANDDYATAILPVCMAGDMMIKHLLRTTNDNILVHCAGGVSRSVSLLIYHMMQKDQELTANDALQFIKERRSIAQPNYKFMEQLTKSKLKRN